MFQTCLRYLVYFLKWLSRCDELWTFRHCVRPSQRRAEPKTSRNSLIIALESSFFFVCLLTDFGRLTANDWFVSHQWSFKHEIITENEWNHFYALHHLVEIIFKKAKNWISASNKLIEWFVNHQPPFKHVIITENEWNHFFRLISEWCLIICFRWNDANYIN